ncbi:hypothetical protein [Actinomadura sp. 6N118]|uniref:hypothetical protein n=1 Tax=Actinomadura sp. 6N118 TaxID=3375151 RepID=UPI0037B4388F
MAVIHNDTGFCVTPAIEWLESEEGRYYFADRTVDHVRPIAEIRDDDSEDFDIHPNGRAMAIGQHDYRDKRKWWL